MEPTRRKILGLSLAAAAAVASPPLSRQAEGKEKGEDEGNVSYFPVYNVRDFGAEPDGIFMNTAPIQRAIDWATGKGGGMVYFPPGNYLTGTISLRNNVTLYLEAGATIWASKDRRDYANGSLIYTENADNAAIRGRGIIDGNGTSFWTRTKSFAQGRHWVADEWRPDALLIFVKCTNLLLEGVTFRNSPSWHIHPIECDVVRILGISILAGVHADHGPNTDGIDPDCCSRMLISDCYIQTGDDSIVLKCTDRPSTPPERRVCRDITVTNCVLISSENALKIGTETYGEFYNIVFSNCAIRDAVSGISLWMLDGGVIDGWLVDNVSMTLPDSGQPIVLTQFQRSRLDVIGSPHVPPEKSLGTVKNVMISNVEATACGGIFLQGMMEKHLEGIALVNIRLHVHAGRDKSKTSNVNPAYPYWGDGRYAPYGIYCRYVDGLKLRNVQLTWETPEDADWGSAIRCRSVNDLEIDGFTGRQSQGSNEPAIQLADTKNAFIHNCWAAENTGDFLRLGEGSQNVSLMNNDLHRAQKAIQLDPGVDAKELYAAGNRLPGKVSGQ